MIILLGMRALLRSRLHRPDSSGSHVHAGAVHALSVVGFGGAKKISTIFPDNVVNTPRGVECLVAHSLRQHMRGDRKSSAGPNFLHLLVFVQGLTVRAHAIEGSHLSVLELH